MGDTTKMESLLWRVEFCQDGRTGWICNAKGERVTKRIAIGTAREITKVHNHMMEYSFNIQGKS